MGCSPVNKSVNCSFIRYYSSIRYKPWSHVQRTPISDPCCEHACLNLKDTGHPYTLRSR